jgi:7-keto-8-aminopelargonate synthetase-like enzyme/predicted N-acyltransferase
MKNNPINLINEIITNGKNKGVGQLITEDAHYDGRNITVNGKKLINFGSCSYLGLEIDDRLKEGAINAIRNFGVQFSSSRTYMSCTLYKEFESLLEQIFEAPIVLATSLSLGHHAVMPVVIEEGDAIILDQQVHASVQDAALKMRARGVYTTIIRHKDLSELKKKISELDTTCNRIWYMTDGVYSMYGDFAPIKEIIDLMNEHKKLYLYIDDAHGFGWIGKNGRGYILNQVPLHSKMVLATSLSKAFGVTGGVFVIPDPKLQDKVKNCGGAFIFSGPHQISTLGAGIASAKIFLSTEVYERQSMLADKIKYCHDLILSYNLPVVSDPASPVFFIGLGLVRMGFNMVKRVMQDGYYVNMSSFPAVPEVCTGIRFTITLHQSYEDISNLITTIAYHFPKALREEGRSFKDISRSFKKVATFQEFEMPMEKAILPSFKIRYENSIEKIDEALWNSLFKDKRMFDYSGLKLLEKCFSNNAEPENNWTFHYYIISDHLGNPVVATFFTCALCKDDVLSQAHASKLIEEKRKTDPYFLTSKNLMMGSLITEGDHLFIQRQISDWKTPLMLLLDELWKLQDLEQASILHLRDFTTEDFELQAFFKEQGFVQISLPETLEVKNSIWEGADNYLKQFNSEKRHYLRKKVFSFQSSFHTEIIQHPSPQKIEAYYQLYLNVAQRSFEINYFRFPKKLFIELATDDRIEFIELSLKDHPGNPVGVAINYKSNSRYDFMLTGMDYNYVESLNLYPNLLWQIIQRAHLLHAPFTGLGLTASQNKRKFNAKQIQKLGFIQIKDSFALSLIDTIAQGGEAA